MLNRGFDQWNTFDTRGNAGLEAVRNVGLQNLYLNSDPAARGVSYDDWYKGMTTTGQAPGASADPRVSSMASTPALFGQNLAQYMPGGWNPGFSPQPFGYSGFLNQVGFQPGMYNWAYPDVRNSGLNPLQHYLGWGMAEGRQGQLGVPGQTTGFGAPFVQGIYGGGAWGGQQAQTMPAPQWAGAPFVGSSFNLGMGMGQQPTMGARPAGAPPPSQEMMDRFAPARTDTKTFGGPMPAAAPFSALGLQAYQQQLGGQIGGMLQPAAPAQAPQQGADRYEQAYLSRMQGEAQKWLAKEADPNLAPDARAQMAKVSPEQRAMVEQLARGELPEALRNSPSYQREVLDKRARAAPRVPYADLTFEQWKERMSPADFLANAQAPAAKQKAAYDAYQAAAASGRPVPEALRRAWNAGPPGSRPDITLDMAWAIMQATGKPLTMLHGDFSLYKNGPQTAEQLAQKDYEKWLARWSDRRRG